MKWWFRQQLYTQILICIVIGTVQGDLHDIGKNLVSALFEGAGFDVVDLGNDVSPDEFVAAVEEKDADLVG